MAVAQPRLPDVYPAIRPAWDVVPSRVSRLPVCDFPAAAPSRSGEARNENGPARVTAGAE